MFPQLHFTAQHETTHGREAFKCDHCDHNYTSIYNMIHHLMTEHEYAIKPDFSPPDAHLCGDFPDWPENKCHQHMIADLGLNDLPSTQHVTAWQVQVLQVIKQCSIIT